jgi:hypothetical protein
MKKKALSCAITAFKFMEYAQDRVCSNSNKLSNEKQCFTSFQCNHWTRFACIFSYCLDYQAQRHEEKQQANNQQEQNGKQSLVS